MPHPGLQFPRLRNAASTARPHGAAAVPLQAAPPLRRRAGSRRRPRFRRRRPAAQACARPRLCLSPRAPMSDGGERGNREEEKGGEICGGRFPVAQATATAAAAAA